jgi:prepilin-type processing-associated H-X9-DG protein
MNAEVGGVSVLRLQSPAATPLCYDGAALAGGMDDAAFRHNGGANCAYVDGHVGWVYEGQWGDQWRTPPSAPAPDAPSPPAPAPPPVPPAPPAPQSDATSRLNARARAQASACQSNLKQVSLAMLMYTQDWDETLPPTRGWPERLYPYTRNHQLLVCPSDRDPHRSEPGDRALSYTMNAALDRRSLLNVARPAEEIGLFDGSAPVGGSDAASFRHAGHLVAGWVDGHVRMIPEDEWETWWRPAEEDGPHSADRAR